MRSKFLLLFVLLLCSGLTNAQNIIQFNYSLNNTYSHVESALLKKQLLAPEYVNYRYLLLASVNYVDDPLIVKDIGLNQRESVLISSYFTIDFGAAFHLSKNLLVGFQSGFTRATLNGFNPTTFFLNGLESEESSLTDTRIKAKWRITDADSEHAVALIPQLRLPTGSDTSFTTDNSAGFGIDLAYETILTDWIQISANLGYHHSPDAVFIEGTNLTSSALDYRDRVLTSIGSYIPFNDRFGANLEYTKYWAISDDGDQGPNEFYAGLRYQASRPLAFFAGLGIGNVDNERDSNDFKFSAGLKFHGGSLAPVKRQPIGELQAIDDSVVVPYNQTRIIQNLNNDLITDRGVGYLKIISNSEPRYTKCEVIKDQLTVKYTPAKNYVGSSVCRYEYCTSTGLCDQANINILTQAPKAKLATNDDKVVLPLGQPSIINALQNDFIPRPANGYLRIVSNSAPDKAKCEIVQSPLGVKYTPIKRFVGTTVCRYEYCSAQKVCDQSNIYITIDAPKVAPVKAEPYGDLVWNKSIYFCNDCDFLNARSLQVTRELRDYIASKNGRIAKVIIEGHTSLVASKSYNLNLSKRRSRNTYKQLRKLGIPASLMKMVAYGESRPEIKSFESNKKHPTNRRVEFRIYEKVE